MSGRYQEEKGPADELPEGRQISIVGEYGDGIRVGSAIRHDQIVSRLPTAPRGLWTEDHLRFLHEEDVGRQQEGRDAVVVAKLTRILWLRTRRRSRKERRWC